MPPSGFSKKTITELLAFVQGNYKDLLEEVRLGEHPDFETATKHEIGQLQKALEKLYTSGFSKKTIIGLLTFVQGNYEDLLTGVRSGKHPNFEDAIEYEIAQLDKALTKLHIDKEGNLVERIA